MSDLETPEQLARRRSRAPAGERLAHLEARCDALDDDHRELRRSHARLEARLWLLVTGSAAVGSAAGASLAQLLGG